MRRARAIEKRRGVVRRRHTWIVAPRCVQSCYRIDLQEIRLLQLEVR